MGPSFKEDRSFLWVKAREKKGDHYLDDDTKAVDKQILSFHM